MAAFSKLTAAAVGVVLGGGAALWLIIPLLRRRLAQSSPTKEIVEVLFFPDLPAGLFIAGNTTSRSEETFGLNMQKDREVSYISEFISAIAIHQVEGSTSATACPQLSFSEMFL